MADSGGSASFGKGKESTSQTVDIPDFLKPVINAITGNAAGLTQGVSNLARNAQNMVAPFNPLQQEGQQMAVDVARGGGDFLPTAQNYFMQAAQGVPISQYTAGFDDLSRYSGGGGANMDPTAMDTLRRTAGGEFLYGGPAFDKAVQAAMETVAPQVKSIFGDTRGGLSGVLARENLGQQGINTFAQQYLQQQGNMLDAASQLGNFGQMDANRAFNAAAQLSNLSDAERQRSLFAAQQLPGIGNAGSDILRMIGGEQQNLDQAMRSAPFNAQLQVLQSLLSGLPLQSMFGRSGQGEVSQASFGWGGN
jgi:hypothetical protein